MIGRKPKLDERSNTKPVDGRDAAMYNTSSETAFLKGRKTLPEQPSSPSHFPRISLSFILASGIVYGR